MTVFSLEFKGITCAFRSKDRNSPTYIAIGETTMRGVRSGEFASVVGPTGCGKSTLLNIGAGLLRPTQASVKVFGQVLERINRRAGYMFQSDALMPCRGAIGWRWRSRWYFLFCSSMFTKA